MGVTTWFTSNWNLVVGLGMTFAAVFAIPFTVFVHRLISADVLRRAEKRAKELADKHLENYERHRTEVIGKLTQLESGHSRLVDEVHTVKALTLEIDSKTDAHAVQLAAASATLDLIKRSLNGYILKEKGED